LILLKHERRAAFGSLANKRKQRDDRPLGGNEKGFEELKKNESLFRRCFSAEFKQQQPSTD
jgi:hypothetical protein